MSDTSIEALRYSEFPNSSDCISRQAAIDELKRISFFHWFECGEYLSEDARRIEIISSNKALEVIEALPSAQPEQHEIGYSECANAMLKMWIDNVLTDGEYNRIMDKLNAHWAERREE